MKGLLYDWLGLNEWLFHVLYRLNGPFLDRVWVLLSYGYGYWVAALAGLAISVRYLNVRHTASAAQLNRMADMSATLILGFSLIWCVVYTVQTVTLWPAPWVLYSDGGAPSSVVLWHEGFPASAPAIAMMMATVFWRYSRTLVRQALVVYVLIASMLSVVSGQNWPADVVAGLLIGYAGVRLARTYYYFGTRLAAR